MKLPQYLALFAIANPILWALNSSQASDYVGSIVCRNCHSRRFQSQSETAHANALRRANLSDPGPGSHAQWAFGAGLKARTWVTQTSDETVAEHGQSYYSATKSLALTPGHDTDADLIYRTFDPVESALRCFRCHSTGPVKLTEQFVIQPSEPGVHCEACHGPGRAHAESAGKAVIQNPRRLSSVQISTLCGACHRQASDLDNDSDWNNVWNVRHQPRFLHRAACFRNSKGALSCLTCHDPHQPLLRAASSYNPKCLSCHTKVSHTISISSRACTECHMPQVATTPNLTFTNHWIGIYDQDGDKLMPTRRVVKNLRPVVGTARAENGFLIPGDVSTLAPVYAEALELRERQTEPGSVQVARAAFQFGRFLFEIKQYVEATAPLRRALSIDESKAQPEIDADREGLAMALEAQGKLSDAVTLFRQAAEGNTAQVAARSYVKLAEHDQGQAEVYYAKAVAAEEKASGLGSPRVALLLYQYALTLRAHRRDGEAEPILRRALSIEQNAPKADVQVTVGVLNALGNLLEGENQLDEAERLERSALSLAEKSFGPESVHLATTCTNLADVLWNKKDLREAGQFYRRAIAINTSIYGPDRPETAADMANLGVLLGEAGQPAEGIALLKASLTIYEKALGASSEEVKFVKENLAHLEH